MKDSALDAIQDQFIQAWVDQTVDALALMARMTKEAQAREAEQRARLRASLVADGMPAWLITLVLESWTYFDPSRDD